MEKRAYIVQYLDVIATIRQLQEKYRDVMGYGVGEEVLCVLVDSGISDEVREVVKNKVLEVLGVEYYYEGFEVGDCGISTMWFRKREE